MRNLTMICATAVLALAAAPAVAAQYILTDLGDLPGGPDYSVAYGINDAGQVVGVSSGATGVRAFLWSGGVLQDLNCLIDASGWTLTNARGINNLGQVVGWGFNADGAQRGFLLTPVSAAIPEPSTWAMLLGFFSLGAVIRRQTQDLRDEFKSAHARPHSG